MSKILIEAAKIGDLTTIKKLIIDNPNIDVDCYDDTIVTALHYAAKNGYAEIVDELIKKQAWVDRLNGKSETALHCAVESRHIVIVNKLLDAKANIDALDTYSQTPLFKAIQNSDFTLFKILLARGANVYSQNYNNETLLHYAAQYGCVRIMEQLTQLKNMEFLELQNLEGLTALHFAAIYDHTDMVELLLNAQANIHAVTEKSETPLHCAAQKGNTATALKLIERKINIEAQNVDGETALFCAVRAGCAPIVEMLIHAKANIEAKNLEGKTALQCAVELNQNAIVEILLCHGAIVSADFRWIVSFHSPSSSNSALDMLYHADNLLSLVKRKNRKHDVDLLRKLKTGLNGKEHVGGNTALHLAILSENVKLTALLFEFGAAMDMPNKENKTVVDYVNKSDNPRIKFAYLKRLLKDLQDKRSVSHLSTSIPTLTLSAEKDVKNIKESKDIKSLIERDSTATAASGSAASTSTSSSGSAGAVASMTCYSQRETTQIGKEKVEPEQTLPVLDTLVKNIFSYIEKKSKR